MSVAEAGGGIETAEAGLPLGFEAWADLSARLLGLDQEARLDLLDERHVEAEDWARCDEHYARVIADDVEQLRLDRADVYGKKCAAEMARRRAEPETPAVSPPPAEAPATPPVVEVPVTAGPVEAPVPASSPRPPSYLQDRAAAPVVSVATAPADVATTAGAFELPSALRGAALPFRDTGKPSAMAVPSASRPAVPAVEHVGETQALGADAAHLAAALPFAGASTARGPAFPRMPLQTYASLCAELAVAPAQAAEIRKKYAVADDASQVALDQHWQARFEAHPATRTEWQQLVNEYRQWLAAQGR